MTDEKIAKLILAVVENEFFEGQHADETVDSTFQHLKDATPAVRQILLKAWKVDLAAYPTVQNYALVGMILLADSEVTAAIPEIKA